MSYILQNVPPEKWAALKLKTLTNQTTIRQVFLDAIDAYLDVPPPPPALPAVNAPWVPTANYDEPKVPVMVYMWQSIRDYLKKQPGSYGEAITRAVLQDQARIAAAAPPQQQAPPPTAPVVETITTESLSIDADYLAKGDCTLTDTKMCPKIGIACPFFDAANFYCKYY